MTILGLETATAVCSVGIFQTGKTEVERHFLEPRVHSERILSIIDELLRSQHLGLDEVDAVAVSQGPGSFTGLRIGFSTAKGLCYATGRGLIAVSTFDGIAEAAAADVPNARNILVALDAKKGDFYSGLYELRDGNLVRQTEISVGLPTFKSNSDHPDLLLTDRGDLLKPFFGTGTDIRPVFDFCRGDVIARLGGTRAAAGEFADAATCEPAYLKDFVVKGRGSAG